MPNIVAILGSVTPPGRLHRAVEHGLSTLTADAELLDLANYKVGFADGRPLDQLTDDTAAAVAKVSAANGVIIASPIYRATLTGSLKNFLDLLPVEALAGKPVAIVTMGATLHHYLGADWHIREILSWFGALALPTSVYLSSADFADGQLVEKAKADIEALVAGLDAVVANGWTIHGPAPLAARRG